MTQKGEAQYGEVMDISHVLCKQLFHMANTK